VATANQLNLARRFFAEGDDIRSIARQLGVGGRTVYRWKQQDAARGIRWEELTDETRRVVPAVLLRRMEALMLEIAEAPGISPVRKADALQRLSSVLTRERQYLERRYRRTRGKGDG
jgi:transposase